MDFARRYPVVDLRSCKVSVSTPLLHIISLSRAPSALTSGLLHNFTCNRMSNSTGESSGGRSVASATAISPRLFQGVFPCANMIGSGCEGK